MADKKMKYFELNDDINFPNRWYLGDISEVDNWELSTSVPENTSNLKVELVRDGEELDFTFTEAYGVPIVSEKVKQELECFPEVKFLPLKVNKSSCKTSYYAMVIQQAVECVDEEKSEFQKFEVNDPVRPDKAGEYRGFMKLRLDPNYIVDVDIFRVKKFEIAIIVSERVKTKLEAIGTTGLVLSDVA